MKDEERNMWDGHFKTAQKTLAKLKEEIHHGELASYLNIYLEKKDMELENEKSFIKITHVNKVNYICEQEMDNWKHAMLLSSNIIQECYLLLRGFDNLDVEIEEKLECLVKLYQGLRSVKFVGIQTTPIVDENGEPLENILNLSDFEEKTVSNNEVANKRTRSDHQAGEEKRLKISSQEPFQFARPEFVKPTFDVPKATKSTVNMNETQVLSSAASNVVSDDDAMETEDMNATYCMLKPMPTRVISKGMSNVLMEANMNLNKAITESASKGEYNIVLRENFSQ